MNQNEQDREYLAYVVNAIRVCADYRPKLRHGADKGYTLLDARIPTDSVPDAARRKAVRKWIADCAADLDVSDRIASTLQGVVFEVRQGYKSKDSKRQNADIANASTAIQKHIYPVSPFCHFR